MTPTHPKLRDALLTDRGNRRAGLTPARFRDYETLLGQLFYVVNYPPPQIERAEPPAASKPAEKTGDRYQITADVLRALNAAGMSYCAQEKLRASLLNLLYTSRDVFEAALEETLREDYSCYRDLVTERAVVPAVEIDPLPVPGEEDLVEEIKKFRAAYMPNYQPVYNNWLKQQKAALRQDQLGIGGLLGQSLAIILLWLKNKPGKGLSNFFGARG